MTVSETIQSVDPIEVRRPTAVRCITAWDPTLHSFVDRPTPPAPTKSHQTTTH